MELPLAADHNSGATSTANLIFVTIDIKILSAVTPIAPVKTCIYYLGKFKRVCKITLHYGTSIPSFCLCIA